MKQYMKQFISLALFSSMLAGSLQSVIDESSLPPCGYGFLQLLRNESTFPAKVFGPRAVPPVPPE